MRRKLEQSCYLRDKVRSVNDPRDVANLSSSLTWSVERSDFRCDIHIATSQELNTTTSVMIQASQEEGLPEIRK